MEFMRRRFVPVLLLIVLWCGVARAADADSTSAFEMEESDIEAAIESGLTGDLDEFVSDVRDRSLPTRSGPKLALDVVDGGRRSLRAAASVAHTRALARWTPQAWAAAVEVRRVAVVENVVVGGVRARFGEGLLLGAAPSLYGAPRRTAGRASVDATTSLWSARRGAGLVLRAGRTRAAVVGWEADARRSLWCLGERVRDGTTISGAVGRVDDDRGASVLALSAAFAHTFDGALVACEVASMSGNLLASARLVSSDGWSAELFSAAATGGFGAGGLDPEDLTRRQVGAALHRSFARGRVSLYSVRRRSDTDIRMRRRVEWRARHPGERIEFVLRLTDDLAWTRAREVADPTGAFVRTRTALCRVRATFAIAPGIDTGCTLSTERDLVGAEAGTTGVVAGWTLDLRRGQAFDARVVASSYALGSGQLGYVSRAGIGGYESASVVSRQGGEVSARAGLRRGVVHVSGFVGQPLDAPLRVLLALGVAR